MLKPRRISLNHYPKIHNVDGVNSFITMDCDSSYYDRKTKFPLGLKIFKNKYHSLQSFMWKLVPLYDATRIQNLYWFYGLAPRIYDLVEVEYCGEVHIAQVTEILPEEERGKLEDGPGKLMNEVNKKYGIGRLSIDPNPKHQYKKYLVDFSQHKLLCDVYESYLKEEMVKNAGWGSNPATYQSAEELGVFGQRSLDGRLQAYHWDEIDFTGKTVLDYGCSSGQTARECLKRGARHVVGLDLPRVAKVAFELSNYLGYFNIDYYGDNFNHEGSDVYGKIKEYTGKDKFDIVLYLSVMQLKKPPYLKEIVGKYFFLEGHTADKDETYRPWLEENFNKVEFLGASKDHSIRPVFRCTV